MSVALDRRVKFTRLGNRNCVAPKTLDTLGALGHTLDSAADKMSLGYLTLNYTVMVITRTT